MVFSWFRALTPDARHGSIAACCSRNIRYCVSEASREAPAAILAASSVASACMKLDPRPSTPIPAVAIDIGSNMPRLLQILSQQRSERNKSSFFPHLLLIVEAEHVNRQDALFLHHFNPFFVQASSDPCPAEFRPKEQMLSDGVYLAGCRLWK